jgi:ribosomal protein S12 methylthiotransferase accessory factor
LEEAIVQGFLELVERDSYAIWWYNKLKRAEVDLSEFEDSYIRDLQKELDEAGCRTWMLDVTNDLGIPSYVAISHWTEDSQEQIEFGSGAHFDTRIAALRALTELNQFMSIRLIGNRGSEQKGSDPLPLKDHPYLTPIGGRAIRPDFRAEFNRLDAREQVMACVRIAERENLDFLVLDQTRPDIGVPVARVIVPGLRHFYRRFAPGRLYDIPIKLGWLDTPTPENELNPLLPPT